MDLQVFLESFTGQISVIVVIAVLFAVIAKRIKVDLIQKHWQHQQYL